MERVKRPVLPKMKPLGDCVLIEEEAFESYDKHIGLKRLELSHCNDSKVDLGEHKDRHEHLGKGFIGKKGFEAIVASKGFSGVNLILETEPDLVADDVALLKKIRGKK